MESPTPHPEPTPQDSLDAEQHVIDLTRMTREAARTYIEFHTGMRWLRRDAERRD